MDEHSIEGSVEDLRRRVADLEALIGVSISGLHPQGSNSEEKHSKVVAAEKLIEEKKSLVPDELLSAVEECIRHKAEEYKTSPPISFKKVVSGVVSNVAAQTLIGAAVGAYSGNVIEGMALGAALGSIQGSFTSFFSYFSGKYFSKLEKEIEGKAREATAAIAVTSPIKDRSSHLYLIKPIMGVPLSVGINGGLGGLFFDAGLYSGVIGGVKTAYSHGVNIVKKNKFLRRLKSRAEELNTLSNKIYRRKTANKEYNLHKMLP